MPPTGTEVWNTMLTASIEHRSFDLHVRGEVPSALEGHHVIAASRRNKDRFAFSRWHDSQADLIRFDLHPGKPDRIRVHVVSVDPFSVEFDSRIASRPFYPTQPNHGINIQDGTVRTTNLLFGSPLEVDLVGWQPRGILRYVEPTSAAPQISSTSHFAWTLDRR
jgi:hypothetical protein